MNRINVYELVGKNAISMQSGSILYNALFPLLKKGDKVELDFEGVSLFASPFFNASMGLILKDFTIESVRQTISFKNLSEVGRSLLNHVISNALNYYKNTDSISKGIEDASSSGDIDE